MAHPHPKVTIWLLRRDLGCIPAQATSPLNFPMVSAINSDADDLLDRLTATEIINLTKIIRLEGFAEYRKVQQEPNRPNRSITRTNR